MEYDELGCVVGENIVKVENNILLIPDLQGIILKKEGYYGLINAKGEKVIAFGLTEFYKTVSSGQNTYYMVYNGEKLNVIDWYNERNQNQ